MEIDKQRELAPKQLERVLGFFARVEAKASFVFAINSALLGIIAVRVDRSDFGDGHRFTALGLAVLSLAISYYYIYKCSFPTLSGGSLSLVYFKEIAKLREQIYIKKFREISDDEYVEDVLSQTWRNSQILSQKFNAMKFASIATGLSLAPWTAYLVMAALSHLAIPLF
jgi:hypothetical protein